MMKKIINEIFHSFKQRPVWTAWSILLCPFYYLSVFVAALFLGLINLSFNDFINFINENT